MSPFFFWTILVLFIIILQIIQIASLSGDAQTVDEGPHLLAGYAYLKTGKILLNPEHPPLVKAWAALPLLLLNPDLPPEVTRASVRPTELDQWRLSGDFLYRNSVPADTMLFWARIMMLILLTAAALVAALVARFFFGDIAGLIAFVLFAFEPTVLAHGRIVTTDVGASAFIFLAVFSFYRLLESPTTRRALYAGIFFALALLAKFSALTLIPIFLLLWLIRFLQSKYDKTAIMPSKRMLWLAVLTTCGIIWTLYGWNIERPSHDPKVQHLYERRAILAAESNAYEGYPLAQFIIRTFDPAIQPGTALKWLSDNAPVPAYRYFRGFFDFLAHNYQGHDAYLLGHIYQYGAWQYFPIAYLIKTPIPLLIFLTSAVSAFAIATLRIMPINAHHSTRMKKYWIAVRAVFQQT
ncbi:MAG TPA: phospholipid carrier-dependent glycosyltransferase, partial [Patescibacteria group bacterium]|nr:phospholipid carrier-dependent glycosyltransferase [Patescibacteria group bacterium]